MKDWGPRPFSDSYHKLFLDCSVLSWGLKDTRIRLEGPPGGQCALQPCSRARISLPPTCFRDMQGIDPIHPLVRVLNHIKASGDSSFSSMSLGSSPAAE